MSKETRLAVVALATPLIMALCGWINAYSKRVEAERETVVMSDDFQEYIEYVMKQRGCEP